METIKFKNIPVSKDYKIPFNLTDQGLMNWLHSLKADQNHSSCKQLLDVLQAFNHIELTQQQLLNFLPKISDKLDLITEQCEKDYLETGMLLDAEAQSKADTVTLTWLSLAENFGSLGRKLLAQENAGNQTATALYMSISSLGKALLNNALIYMAPYEGFWLYCYQIYSIAEIAGLLDIEITAGEKKGETVNTEFKHLLLFELSGTDQFRPREMKTIFSALKKFSTQVNIACDRLSLSNPCFLNLNRDLSPHNLFPAAEQPDRYDRYISTLIAAKSLNQFLQQEFPRHNALQSLNRSLFIRVIKSLDPEHKRKFSRTKEHRTNTGIIGFNFLVSFLYKMQRLDKDEPAQLPKKDPRIAQKWQAPDLDLVPIGDELVQQMQTQFKKNTPADSNIFKILQVSQELSSSKKVWNPLEIEKNKLVENIPTGEFEIIESSALGFNGSWKDADDMKVKVGEIIALPTDKRDRVEVGLIRRISRTAQENVCLGIEILGFQSEAVRIIRPGQKEMTCWAVLLPGIPALKQTDSIIYNTSDFSTGEFIILRRGKKNFQCRLNKLINSTAAITHMELFYPQEPN